MKIKEIMGEVKEWLTASGGSIDAFYYGETVGILPGVETPAGDQCWFCGICIRGEAGYVSQEIARRDGYAHFGLLHPEIEFDGEES